MSANRTIIVGGGLAGLSAAHTTLEKGGSIVLLDKKPSLGGNSVKASSGINGAGTEAQKQNSIQDSATDFALDTTTSAGDLARPLLIKALTSYSAPSVEWLTKNFGIDLSLVARLGGHSIPRTHRGKGGAPGWAITSALIKKLEQISQSTPERARVLKNAKVVRLLEDKGRVIGVEYDADGHKHTEKGSVIIATGGYAADFAKDGFLAKYRPDLLSFPTTNGDHASGDGHRLVLSLSHAGTLNDMDQIQVHPTGFIDPKAPDAKTKFLAAEALRGVGGLLVNANGERFVNELDRRDAVTDKMQKVIAAGNGPVRIILNVDSYDVLKAHCEFYVSKGLMKRYNSSKEFATESHIDIENLKTTYASHSSYASGNAKDSFGKLNFENSSYNIDDPVYVAEMTPVVHYTMGGISVDADAHVLDAEGKPILGLYAAGEAIGGVHGKNRLGGSSLLEAVVFGRIAGENAFKEI